jgi:hypothetical protein
LHKHNCAAVASAIYYHTKIVRSVDGRIALNLKVDKRIMVHANINPAVD